MGAFGRLGLSGPTNDPIEESAHGDFDEALVLCKQGASLSERYRNAGVLADLDEGINMLRMAHEIMPDNHPAKATRLSCLGASLQIRFRRLGDPSDLEMAIAAQQQA